MGQGREKGRGGVHVVPVNWDGAVQAGAQGTGLSNQGARQYLGAAPIQVDDARAHDTSTTSARRAKLRQRETITG
jgi:hypothetical protein